LSITRLSWRAITVHKARVDFDKAAIDVSQVLCQAYVALSRLRSLEGLILLSPYERDF
jgi:hypothetical protein